MRLLMRAANHRPNQIGQFLVRTCAFALASRRSMQSWASSMTPFAWSA